MTLRVASYGDRMDTQTEYPTSLPSVATLMHWTSTRVRQRREFAERAEAGATVRGSSTLTWPDDQAWVLSLGVPCDDCLAVVTILPEGIRRRRHWLAVIWSQGTHWAEGITAHCGGSPAS